MSDHVYVNPENIVSYPGDIQREHPDWQDTLFVYPEFEEGHDETNTAAIKVTIHEPELSITTDENGVSVYSFIWNPATYDIVQETLPHENS